LKRRGRKERNRKTKRQESSITDDRNKRRDCSGQWLWCNGRLVASDARGLHSNPAIGIFRLKFWIL